MATLRWPLVVSEVVVLTLMVMAAPGQVAAQEKPMQEDNPDTPFMLVEGHFSLLSDSVERSLLGNSFGYGGNFGYRWDNWGSFLHVEHNLWVSSELDREVVNGALNFGLGGEYHFYEGRARTSLTIGPSVLLFDTLLDKAGEVGFFFDLRPVGLRWKAGKRWTISLDPLTFGVISPVLDRIPLVIVEYRTILAFEFDM